MDFCAYLKHQNFNFLMNTEVKPNIDMLTWAIQRAGYEVRDFTTRFPKVLDWLEDKKKPTLKQLEDFSKRVHLPFGYLFLDKPPKESLSFPFFRSGKAEKDNVSLNLYDAILLMQKRQDWLAEYLNENEFKPLEFVGKFAQNHNYQEIVDDIRKVLNLNTEWASNLKSWEDALNYLSGKIEEAGIIMTFNSVVENNNYRPIEVEECRGFVLVDRFAPFMFVNAADGKAAQMFTIAHELAHIWIGKSAGFDIEKLMPADDPIELLCDQIAAEFLVPKDSFLRLWERNQDLKLLARHFKISPIVIARRALDLHKITRQQFFNFYNAYVAELKTKKANTAAGGDFYATQKKRMSLRFAAHINQAVKEKQLLYRDAFKLTGLKGDTYQKFITKSL